MSVIQDRDERTLGRAELYRWFSAVFAKEQTQATWTSQTEDDFLGSLEAYAAEFGLDDEAAPLVAYLAAHRGVDPAPVLLDLAVDYARLFIGPGPGLASPYESVHTSAEGRLFGDAYADLIDLLHREQIGIDKTYKEPADHVAVELAVAAYLVDRELGEEGSEAAAEGAEQGTPGAEAAYLRTHVLNWMPRWCELVVKHAQTDYYRGAAKLMAAFLEKEKQALA